MRFAKKKIYSCLFRFQRIKKSKSIYSSFRKNRVIWILGLFCSIIISLSLYQLTHIINLRFNTPKEFLSVWNANDSLWMHKMLTSFDEVMARHQIEHFMIFETLLGSLRHGDFIPWNRQVIFAINEDQLLASFSNISTSLEQLDLVLQIQQFNRRSNSSEEYSKDKISIQWKYIDNLEIELIPYYSNEKHVIIDQEDKIYRFPQEHVRPISRRMLHGSMYCSPKQPEKLLNSIYGSGWPVFCYSGEFAIPCRDLRFSYYMSYRHSSEEIKIPKIIHQLWIGSGKPPHDVMETCRRLHPDWEYNFWNNSNIPERMKARRIFDVTKTLEGRADILRWEILNKYGGVWIDADTACLKPLDDILEVNVEFFFGYHHYRNPEHLGTKKFEDDLLSTNVIGVASNHPILKKMMVDLRDNYKQVPKETSRHYLGPNYLTKFIEKEAESERFLEMSFGAFPFYFFVPVLASFVFTNQKHKLETNSVSETPELLYNSYTIDLHIKS